MKKVNPKILIPAVAGGVCTLIIAVVVFFMTPQNTTAGQLQEKLELGNKYLESGEYEKAEVAFQQALEIDEKSPEATVRLADTYNKMKQPEKALEMLEQTNRNLGDMPIETLNSNTDSWRNRLDSYETVYQATEVLYEEQNGTGEQNPVQNVTNVFNDIHVYVANYVTPTPEPTQNDMPENSPTPEPPKVSEEDKEEPEPTKGPENGEEEPEPTKEPTPTQEVPVEIIEDQEEIQPSGIPTPLPEELIPPAEQVYPPNTPPASNTEDPGSDEAVEIPSDVPDEMENPSEIPGPEQPEVPAEPVPPTEDMNPQEGEILSEGGQETVNPPEAEITPDQLLDSYISELLTESPRTNLGTPAVYTYGDESGMTAASGILGIEKRDFNGDGMPEFIVISIRNGQLALESYSATTGSIVMASSVTFEECFGKAVDGVTYGGTQECFVIENAAGFDIGMAGYYFGMNSGDGNPSAKTVVALYTMGADGSLAMKGSASLINGSISMPQEGGKDGFISTLSTFGMSGAWITESADMLVQMDLINNPVQDMACVPNPLNGGLAGKETGVQDLVLVNAGMQPGTGSMNFSVTDNTTCGK